MHIPVHMNICMLYMYILYLYVLYLVYSASSCINNLKDSSNSDFSFDIEAILSSIREPPKANDTAVTSKETTDILATATVTVEDEDQVASSNCSSQVDVNQEGSGTGIAVVEPVESSLSNGGAPPTTEGTTSVQENEVQELRGLEDNGAIETEVFPDNLDENKNVLVDKVEDRENVNEGKVEEDPSSTEVGVVIEKRQRRGTFTKDDDEPEDDHNDNGVPSDLIPVMIDDSLETNEQAAPTCNSNTLPTTTDKPLPQALSLSTSTVSVNSSVSGKSSSTSLTSQSKTKPLEKKTIKPPARLAFEILYIYIHKY